MLYDRFGCSTYIQANNFVKIKEGPCIFIVIIVNAGNSSLLEINFDAYDTIKLFDTSCGITDSQGIVDYSFECFPLENLF